ncbi:hypothetical protein SAMN03159341_102529 [Paenibacillus sp. 1_12]|uniref:LysM peptidoglycan-binding domain-containing protein n=1 Tax=Paenibacillus sp. 1_12 TaxID=1566278 RepID=UPI0008E8FBD7|nr:LysM domain-containing protein [Paenibacillus sp. 1_12]SFK98147.1 hypothetical protein SAMN03159341_102529 [Paenibacillus sp. 1_12]
MDDRAFELGGFSGFGGGFGHTPLFNPFFRQQSVPFFFLSPSFFPSYRGEDDRDGNYYAQHQCQEGENMENVAQMYNVPQPILEAMNPHIQNPNDIAPGSTAYIPRLDKMNCHTMYMQQEVPANAANTTSFRDPEHQTMPYPGIPQMYAHGQYPHPNYPQSHTQQFFGVHPQAGGYYGPHGVGFQAGGHLGGHGVGVHAGSNFGSQGVGVHAGGHLGGYGTGIHAGSHFGSQGVGVQAGGHLGDHGAGIHAGTHFGHGVNGHGVGVHTGGHLGNYGAGIHAGTHFGGHGVGVHAGGHWGNHEAGVHADSQFGSHGVGGHVGGHMGGHSGGHAGHDKEHSR